MSDNDIIKDQANDFSNKIKEISEKLELNDKQKIIGIDFKENMKLGGTLERNNVFVVKIKDEDGEIHHIVMSKDIDKIADINKDGKINLSEEEKKKWEQFIGTKEYQNAEQKKMYNFDEEYYVEDKINFISKENEKEDAENENDVVPEEKKKEGLENKTNIVPKENKKEDLDSKTDVAPKENENDNQTAIVAMIKIEDRENFGQAINRNLKSDSYIVKYGNNKTKIMQMDSKGKLKEISGLESNEFNQDVIEQLNVDNRKDNQKIKVGDLKTIKAEDSKCKFVVVREQDPKKGIVIVNSPNSTKVYTFDDEGKDSLKEIETSIKYEIDKDEKGEKTMENEAHHAVPNEAEKDDEYEGRTPWGDAYARSRR